MTCCRRSERRGSFHSRWNENVHSRWRDGRRSFSRMMDGTEGRGLYRSRSGRILGVCRGLADYFDAPVFWVRAIAVAALIFTGFWPVTGIYLIAALLMKKEPVVPFKSEDDAEFYNSFASSRTMAVNRLKRMYENLDRRTRRMEEAVTDREFDWDRRLREGR